MKQDNDDFRAAFTEEERKRYTNFIDVLSNMLIKYADKIKDDEENLEEQLAGGKNDE